MQIAGRPTPAVIPSARELSVTKALSNFATTEALLKILYISQYYPPEMGAPAARVSELSQHWVEAGHEVTVLTGFPNHPDGVIRPEYQRYFRRGLFREKRHGVEVVRTWLLPFPNRKPHERILNYTSFCASAALTGSFLKRPDIVIATSPQLLVGPAGWWIAQIKRVPFILEVRDLWPESLAAVGVGDSQSLLNRALGKLASFLYQRSDHIVVVTPAFREQLMLKWQVSAEKISIVPNGVETKLFSPHKLKPELRTSLNADGKFLVSYIGTLGLAHGLDTLVAAAEFLQHAAPDILFMLVGDGADRERIQALTESKKITNIRFLAPLARERIPAYICASDACLVLLKKSDVFETVIPTKMLEFMSCARPVILSVRGQAQRLLESCRGGVCIEPENAQALCAAILNLRERPALARSLGQNGRQYIAQNLSRQRTATNYLEVLSGLLRSQQAEERIAAA